MSKKHKGYYIKYCKQCGCRFSVYYSLRDRKFCSKECVHKSQKGKKAFNNKQQWVLCKTCKTPFLVSPSRFGKKMYCSRKCFHVPVYTKCKYCQKEFRSSTWRLTHNKDIYCGQSCQWKHKIETTSIEINCEFCGKEFLKKRSQYIRSRHHFCSPECSVCFHVDENHYGFIGGTGYGREWKKIRQEIRERDKVCRLCGKTPEENGRALDVHHLIRFYDFGYEKRIEAHNNNNLITVCRSCHHLLEGIK